MLSFHISLVASLYFKFLLIANARVAIETDDVVEIVVEIGVVVVEAVVGIVVDVVVAVELLGMQLVHWLGRPLCSVGWSSMKW